MKKHIRAIFMSHSLYDAQKKKSILKQELAVCRYLLPRALGSPAKREFAVVDISTSVKTTSHPLKMSKTNKR